MMHIETTIFGLNAKLNQFRQQGQTIGFVPTMGNLHQGHLTLVREAKKHCDIVVISIFVNPIQFGVNEDFDSYPRTLDADCRQLETAQGDVVFAPSIEQMYGKSPRLTTTHVAQMTTILCGASRHGHFDGVTTVVNKLFNIVRPDKAFFGEKDWQQLAVIRRMVYDLNIPVDIVGVPIVRAEDGLALSSRNGYLSEKERQLAPNIHLALQHAKQQLQQGISLAIVLTQLEQFLSQTGFNVDYVAAYTPELMILTEFNQDMILFVAAKLGTTRLIDNVQVNHVSSS